MNMMAPVTVGDMKAILQEFPDNANIKFVVNGTVTGTASVITDGWFSEETGFECATEEQDVEFSLNDEEAGLDSTEEENGNLILGLSL